MKCVFFFTYKEHPSRGWQWHDGFWFEFRSIVANKLFSLWTPWIMWLLIANYVVCCAVLHHVRLMCATLHCIASEVDLSCKSNLSGCWKSLFRQLQFQSVNIEISDFCYSEFNWRTMPACVTEEKSRNICLSFNYFIFFLSFGVKVNILCWLKVYCSKLEFAN